VPNDFDVFLQNIKSKIDNGTLKLIIFDCKSTFVSAAGLIPSGTADMEIYGQSLAQKIKQHGISADKVVLSVPRENAKALHDAVTRAGLNCKLDAYVESGGSGTEADFTGISAWADKAIAAGASFQGIGLDEAVRGNFYQYAYRVAEMIKRRDLSKSPAQVYFWTVNNKSDMRQLLDYGVDAILTDEIATLKSLLNEEPYKGIYIIK
jgi:hypothetical protein